MVNCSSSTASQGQRPVVIARRPGQRKYDFLADRDTSSRPFGDTPPRPCPPPRPASRQALSPRRVRHSGRGPSSPQELANSQPTRTKAAHRATVAPPTFVTVSTGPARHPGAAGRPAGGTGEDEDLQPAIREAGRAEPDSQRHAQGAGGHEDSRRGCPAFAIVSTIAPAPT